MAPENALEAFKMGKSLESKGKDYRKDFLNDSLKIFEIWRLPAALSEAISGLSFSGIFFKPAYSLR